MKIRPFPLFRVLTTQFRDGSSDFAGARRSRAYVRGGVAGIGVGAIAITPYFHPSSWFTGSKKGPETYQHVSQVGPGSTPQTLMSRAYGAIGYARSSPAGVLEKETKPDSASVAPLHSVLTGGVNILQALLYRDSDEIAKDNASGVSEKSAEPDNGARAYRRYIIGGVVGGAVVLALCVCGLDSFGFTHDGIRIGSWAAEWMSKTAIKYGGGVPAGDIIAKLQSAGVLGFARETIVKIWAAGFAVGVIVSALFKNKD
ncbi:uncharacterized protein LOC106181534 [Lingula anatina]|uniref:Uncharacterized protein LOC106181534 n=1 Tax=Lingula anatina TaxID=7574 RepID=A0A1S3KFI9_LINAN|nr:uncharacterized protein LOC106181534 [Lingula anatina]|eukprot:XP_013421405.1 uncharacterized protein LOC106181534 [Lingula anatina]